MAKLNAYEVLSEVVQERINQEEKWGPQNHSPLLWLGILGEEFGEVSKAVIEMHFDGSDASKIREELIQVAAVAVAAIESLDRNELSKEES